MRPLDSALNAYLQGNSDVIVRQLLWIEAKNRTTGAVETIGLWTGEDHRDFVIGGVSRTYYGCGQFIGLGDLTAESGLNIRRLTVSMTPISPEVEQVLRGYNPKMAPVEVHLAFFSTDSENLITAPLRVFQGWIDKFPISTPAKNGEGEGRIEMVSTTRILTNRLAIKRSNDSQQRRLSGDTFFQDVTVSGQLQTPWGEKTAGQSGFSVITQTVRRLSQNQQG